jgi:omega-6 fatty acid desaturase (delta-12 desaturase)
MTLTEYEDSAKRKQLQDRLYRNPVVLIGLDALFNFLLSNRLPSRRVKRKKRMSVLFTNLLIVAVFLVAAKVIRWRGYLLIELPAVLHWFSSNIGYHHVHHLSPRIPNYHPKKCYDAVPALQAKAPLTILKSLSCFRLKMWDEERQKMVAFP